VIDTHESAVSRPKQEVRVDERSEERDAGIAIETPQATGLRFSQT